MKIKFIHLIVILSFLCSCKKDNSHDDHDHGHDTSVPVITLTSPSDSSVYHTGDTVFITGNVTDNSLHEGNISIKDDTTAQVYYSAVHPVHAMTNVTINYYYVVNVTQNRAATLTVSYVDHAPNTGTVARRLIFLP